MLLFTGTVGSLNISTLGAARHTPPSPAQMDPFYTQGYVPVVKADLPPPWSYVVRLEPHSNSHSCLRFWIALQYVSLMFSISACLIFVANTERSVTTCDATDHVVTSSPLHTASDQGRPGNEAN